MTPTERTEYYLENLFWPTVGAVILVCASYYNIYQVSIIAGVYAVLAGIIARYTVVIQQHWKVGAIVGLLTGTVIGILQSLFLMATQFSVPAVFALFPRTLITAAAIAVASGLFVEVSYIALRFWKKHTTKTSKNIGTKKPSA